MQFHNNQKGGDFLLDNHVSSNVEAIVSGDYKLISDMKNVENMNINLDNCLNLNSMFDVDINNNKFNYIPGKTLKCFIRDPRLTDISLEKKAEYIFKKQFSLDMTDMFMQKYMSEEDLEIATNYIYYVFDYTLTKLLETLIRTQIFGNKSQYLIDRVYLLYKGGNTTRLLLRNFVNNVMFIIDKNMGRVRANKVDVVENTVTKLKELVGSFNIGDWDYMMKIEFDDLLNFGFSTDELEKLVMYLMQVFYSTGSYIKEKISQLLKSNTNIKNLTIALQNYMLDSNIKDRIEKFITKYNSFTKTGDEKIETMKLKRINMYDNVITETEIYRMSQNEMKELYKSSFLFKSSGKLVNYKNNKITYNEYYEVDTPFFDKTSNTQIPEYLTNDNVYLAYLSKLGFMNRYAISDFNLIRIKVSNIIDLDIKYDKIQLNVEKKMFVNTELVDISVPNVNACKAIYNKLYYYPGYNELTTTTIMTENFKQEKTTVIIPSVQMMFTDICTMLFIENMFVWEDPKYAKRIKRLFFLILPCMYSDNLRTKEILINFQTIKTLFTTLNTFDKNIDEKLKYLASHYEIVDNPYDTVIKGKMKHNVTAEFMTLNITHKILIIKDGSIFKLRYLEFLIANYIKMLILAKYILYNVVDPDHEELVLYELQIHRIYELPDSTKYIKPNMTILTPSLTSIYMNIRGTPHIYTGNQLLKLGPMNGLPTAVNDKVDAFLDPRNIDPTNDKALLPYEISIINISRYIEDVLEGMLQAHIGLITPKYTSRSLF
jgi:hypothetical protein